MLRERHTISWTSRALAIFAVLASSGCSPEDLYPTEPLTPDPPNHPEVRARWVGASGNVISSVAVGGTAFLEIDLHLSATTNLRRFDAALQYGSPVSGGREITAEHGGWDLNCSNPGGQATCPSGASPSGHLDVISTYAGGINSRGLVNFFNFTIAEPGIGIQGLAKLQFRGLASGTATLTFVRVEAYNGFETPFRTGPGGDPTAYRD
jgi:hypothetical protein